MNRNFSNKSLKDIHITAEGAISSHLTKLDEVSNDIKTLEGVLSKSGISVTFLYLFEENTECRQSILDDSGADVTARSQHYIVWDRDQQRLLYEVHEMEYELLDGEPYRRFGPSKHSKPLIETKTHIRLKALPELQFFYSQIIQLLGQGQLQDKVVGKSPNLPV